MTYFLYGIMVAVPYILIGIVIAGIIILIRKRK